MLFEVKLPVGEFGGLLRVGSLATQHGDHCSTDLPGALALDFSAHKPDTFSRWKSIPERPDIHNPLRMPETPHHHMAGSIRITNQ